MALAHGVGCRSAYYKEWWSRNREKQAKRAREWFLAHRDQANENHRCYDQRRLSTTGGREAARKQCRDSYARHREERLARIREWRESHRSYFSDWRVDHPESVRAASHRRRARINASPSHFTADDIVAQRRRQRGVCYYCGCSLDESGYHIDHVMPLALGGGNAPENIVLSCPSCNLKKGDGLPWENTGRLC